MHLTTFTLSASLFMLIISAGLQKSGSALIFNMINDIVIHNNGSDVRILKEKHKLGLIIQYENCNISDLHWSRLKRLLFLAVNTKFVVKTHSGPSRIVKFLQRIGFVKVVLIVRDPRDVVISAMDHGSRLREQGRNDTFAVCTSIAETVKNVKSWIDTIYLWYSAPSTLIIKYEDLINSQEDVLINVAKFLNLKVDAVFLETLKAKYDPGAPDDSVKNILHLNKAVVNRFTSVLTSEELIYVNGELKLELKQLGY